MIAPKYTTMVKQIEGGRTVRQGDSGVVFTYQLLDAHGEPIVGKENLQATIHLSNKRGHIIYEAQTTVKKDALVSFNIATYIPPTNYIVSIFVDGVTYPTNTNTRIRVTRSYRVPVEETVRPVIPTNNVSEKDILNIIKTNSEVSALVTRIVQEQMVANVNTDIVPLQFDEHGVFIETINTNAPAELGNRIRLLSYSNDDIKKNTTTIIGELLPQQTGSKQLKGVHIDQLNKLTEVELQQLLRSAGKLNFDEVDGKFFYRHNNKGVTTTYDLLRSEGRGEL